MTKILITTYVIFLALLSYYVIESQDDAYRTYRCAKIEGETLLYSLRERDGFYCIYNRIQYGQAPNTVKRKM